jgi:hypothetical protein
MPPTKARAMGPVPIRYACKGLPWTEYPYVIGPSTTGTGVDVGLGSGEGVAVWVTVGEMAVVVGGNEVGVWVALVEDWGRLVPDGVVCAIIPTGVFEEPVCAGEAISSSTEICVLFAVASVQAFKE